MLKKICIGLVAAFIAVAGFAQGIPTGGNRTTGTQNVSASVVDKSYVFSIGPKVGVNYSLASNPKGYDIGMSGNVGFSAGLAANLRLGRMKASSPGGTGRFGVQLEALFDQRSLKTDIENIKMSCYAVPLLAQIYVYSDFCFEVGPTFTGCFSATPDEFRTGTTVLEMSKVKGNDVMLTVGLAYKNRKGLNISARYNMGNSNLAGNFETKVSTISVGIGWLFAVVK